MKKKSYTPLDMFEDGVFFDTPLDVKSLEAYHSKVLLPSAKMLIFEIYATPPQKQTQFSRHGAYDPSKLDKQQIIWQIRPQAPKEPLKGAIAMELFFYRKIPVQTKPILRSQMITGVARPTTRPDIDNLAYLVTNALKGIVYLDDAQIVTLHLEKLYSENPRTVIKVREV